MFKVSLFVISGIALTLAACAAPSEEVAAETQTQPLCYAEPTTSVANVEVVDATAIATEEVCSVADDTTFSMDVEPAPIPGDSLVGPRSFEIASGIEPRTCKPDWCKTNKGLTPRCQKPAEGQPTLKDYYYKLQKYWCYGEKNGIPTVTEPDHWITPDPGDTCAELDAKKKRADECLRSRQHVQDCFVKECQDDGHKQALQQVIAQKNRVHCSLILGDCY